MRPYFQWSAESLHLNPAGAERAPIVYEDYKYLDDIDLLAMVETLRPEIYAHVAVITNLVTPKISPDIKMGSDTEEACLAGFQGICLAHYVTAVDGVLGEDDMQNLLENTDDMLAVLHEARVRGIFNPVPTSAKPVLTHELIYRGCGTAVGVAVRSLDYIYESIRKGELNWDPNSLSSNPLAIDAMQALASAIAKRVQLQDLGPLMKLLNGKDPFVQGLHSKFTKCPVSLEAPHHVKLKSYIDQIRETRKEVNGLLGYEPYILDHLMCPAVVGLGDIQPIPDLIHWVLRNADRVGASTFVPLQDVNAWLV